MIASEEGLGSRAPVCIAGVGNWLLGSDRIGPRVVERARGRYGPEVEICDIGSGGLNLLDHLEGQELLIVVDACLMDGAPGEIRLLDPAEQAVPGAGGSIHMIGPIEALAIAARLFPARLPRRALIVAVETEGLDEAGEEEACVRVLEVLDQQVQGWGSARPGSE